MKREFPFWTAFLFAIVLHSVLGLVIRNNPFLIAASVPSSSVPQPVQMHFVEVPPGAKTVPQAPNTKYLSDADRKAGPVKQSEKRPLHTTQYARPGGPEPSKTSRPGAAQKSAPASQQSALPHIENSAVSGTTSSDYSSGRASDPQKLAQSLRNLDQYISQGSGGGAEGDVPTGDPGSGVFFDTQGFDLGPWGSRVVAIVRANWIVPVAAQLGVKGIVAVSFQVDRSGRILNAKVISSSQTPSFDQAALNALKSSNPFPPLPADFPRKLLPAVFRFYYNLQVPES